MTYIAMGCTDIGNTKATNQDSFSVKLFKTSSGERMALAVLCDGMGGLSKGEVASSSVVKAFNNWIFDGLAGLCCGKAEFDDSDIVTAWTDICKKENEKIKLYGSAHGISIGTTVTAMLITENRYYIVNVGDTRAYEISDSLKQLTRDQTFVARQVELGVLTPEQAKTDPRRNVLLQCIGASDEVVPEFFFGKTKKNAVYLLCSDGFRHEISQNEILDCLNAEKLTDKQAMTQNINYLIQTNKHRHERDNITAITIRTQA